MYQDRVCSLDWSGIELTLLLRKRLEFLSQTKTDKKRSPEDRLDDVLKGEFGYIPRDISVVFNGVEYRLPLFMYVLRHTFWRPRDLLLYYAGIIATSRTAREKGIELTSTMVRRVVRSLTRAIIRTEFIGEFESTVYNIEAIVAAFRNCKQIVTYEEVSERLAKVDFRFASGRTM